MPAIVPKTYKQMQADFANLIAELAIEAFKRYSLCINDLLYLYGRKGKDSHNCDIYQELRLMTDHEAEPLEGWTLLRLQHVPRSYAMEHLQAMFRDWLKSDPLYVFAD